MVTSTTEYLSNSVPFVWSSPTWFPILVGFATVGLAELRLHLPAPRTSVTARAGLAGVAAVIGIYVVTALVRTAPAVPATSSTRWRRSPGACWATATRRFVVRSPPLEVRWWKPCSQRQACSVNADDPDALFGVAPWLPALYFAFGVVVALLAEIAAWDRYPAPAVR